MDAFSNYIDHLILLLAARFHAPLDISTEELLAPLSGPDPWELVSRNIQQTLCSPQTEQERSHVRQLDVHHFTATVCRERARYVHWRLEDARQRRRAERQKARAASRAGAVVTAAPSSTASAAAATGSGGDGRSFDVTRDAQQKNMSSIYDLVRQSLPSTLKSESGAADDDEDDSEGEVEVGGAQEATITTAAAAGTNALSQVQDVFVRTAEERRRDEEVARARDDFLSQIQALQMVYFNKYRRWMDVPPEVLEPPQTSATAVTSRASSISVHDGAAGPFRSRQSAAEEEAAERAALMEALDGKHGNVAPSSSSSAVAAVRSRQPSSGSTASLPNVRFGVNPTVAAMRRQVHVQRPLRPSEVSEEALETMYRDRPAAPEAAASRVPPKNAPAPQAARDSTAAAVAAAAQNERAAAAPVGMKETAPPASRRGRWQIVEYDDEDDAAAQ